VDLTTPLVGPVSLDVAARECLALTGPSGAGKSLLLRAIADLDPNSGQVALDGRPRETMPAPAWRRSVALVPAESGWWADRVGDHLPEALPGTKNLAGLLADVGLPDALTWSVARLSTGERQRLAIVRALCLEPDVLLLDEPTASLDEAATARVEALVRAFLERGKAVVIVTHDRRQAERLAGRILVMAGGGLTDGTEGAT
jgi:ABC-type iron transport system FetAB ATPase subunit